MVIIAIPSNGDGGLNEMMNQRFGRCPSFTLVTIEEGSIKEVRGVPNNAENAMGGAGIQAAQIVGNNGVKEVIVGFLGPNAVQALKSMNLKIYQAPSGQLTVKEVVELYIKGKLEQIDSANVGSHAGMGGGMGRGMSGGGRGMGGGGRGMGGGGRGF
ncbi:MAG: NifB/NifX family molybdenum-iron cluster-binding protein [Candidatus Lokiarchaeota archaeon]|nr:NifB/NifX family molybdenum-iron cluster-binding protein [Candidatus Lokiarchaeota archaeon]